MQEIICQEMKQNDVIIPAATESTSDHDIDDDVNIKKSINVVYHLKHLKHVPI